MAFLLDCSLEDYEVRVVNSGTSKKGNPYRSIKMESKDGNSIDVSVTDDAYFYDVDKLSKGDVVSCKVMAVAGRDRSYISLRSAPVVTGNAYTGELV